MTISDRQSPTNSITKGSAMFQFGKNWRSFLTRLNEERIEKAKTSLCRMIDHDDLQGLRFLDAGCGSGLFSLAALRLGAAEVVSFDVDRECVSCCRYLDDRYGPFRHWIIYSGSVLNRDWLLSLGKFDVVYSWGVLHHTGAMFEALDNITLPVAKGGILYISIYNDQGLLSMFWKLIKHFYNISPKPVRFFMALGYFAFTLSVLAAVGIARLRPPRKWFESSGVRGMDIWHDVVDWIGGYPFETSKPHNIIDFFSNRGFTATQLRLKKGSGCNEFVFARKQLEMN